MNTVGEVVHWSYGVYYRFNNTMLFTRPEGYTGVPQGFIFKPLTFKLLTTYHSGTQFIQVEVEGWR